MQIHLSRKLYLFIYPKHIIQCHISKTIQEDDEKEEKREKWMEKIVYKSTQQESIIFRQ